jgi:hypothetical protein
VRQAAFVGAEAVLALVFSWAAFTKICHPAWWRGNLRSYRLPPPVYRMALTGVPWGELTIAVCVVGGAPRVGGPASLVMLVLFSAVIVRARLTQDSNLMGCACFGGTRRYDFRVLLLRNAGLAAAAAILWLTAAASVPAGASPALVAALLVTGIAWGIWTGWLVKASWKSPDERAAARLNPHPSRP